MAGYMGTTLFNTIAPPNSPQYAFNSCQGDPLYVWGLSGFVNSTSNHQGAPTTASPMAAFASSRAASTFGPIGRWHQGRRRSDQLRPY